MTPETPTMSIAEATALLTAPGQLFEMEELVIRGVPTRVWKSAPPSLRSVLDLSSGHGDADFLVYEDERISFAQHYRTVATLAHRLRDHFGVTKGDRVAIAMRNLPEWVMAFWAIVTAGGVAVPLNAWWTGDELQYGLADSGSVVAFVDEERAARIRPNHDGLPFLRTVVVASEHRDQPPVTADGGIPELSFAEALGDVDPTAVPPDVDLQPDDDATIFYTSGTTGKPKGAVGTHRNTCTNLMNLFFINTRGQIRFGTSLADTTGKTQTSYLLTVPLFHATGCHAVMITNAAAGGKIVMVHHFDPERALELIERERVTTFGGVPTMVMQVLDSPDLARRDTSSVRSVSYGGAPAPPELVRRIRAQFPVGQPGNGYGLTETSAVTSMITGADYVAHPDSVGPAVPVTDVAVVPEDFDGTEPDPSLPRGPGVTGELWVKGPQVVRGYWNRPEETAQVFTSGWLHTGDVARVDDDGFIYIVDRAKDVIIRGGENVYSVEVEDVLYEHPSVADCAVLGVPHPTLGEEVGAVVVLRPGHKVAAEELTTHVRSRLAAFSVPSRFWFRDHPLPRNPAGKVLKRALRAEITGTGPDRPSGPS
ncbi:MAG: class I adenylate-forming enzyme family protein [Acidimicrobiales bacterium]